MNTTIKNEKEFQGCIELRQDKLEPVNVNTPWFKGTIDLQTLVKYCKSLPQTWHPLRGGGSPRTDDGKPSRNKLGGVSQ